MADSFPHDKQTADELLQGAWKLDHFAELSGGKTYLYSDILIFSQKYYSDFQAGRGDSDFVNSHVGMYKVTGDSISFQIQMSNLRDSIGRVAAGVFHVENGYLKITFQHGAQPGTWVFKRLE
jgi:hypothetical protein